MVNQIIEIYLFVDPLGKRCNKVRKVVKEFRKECLDRIKLRIIPIVNSRKVYRYTCKQAASYIGSFVDKNNHYSTNTYRACLAFYASTTQGQKFGNQFLSRLQEAVAEDNYSFSEDLVFDIAESMEQFDLEMFKEDYHSELVKRIYQKNLRLASDMKITNTPSCVIFKNGPQNEAVRLNKEIENKMLRSICGLNNPSILDEKKPKNQNEKCYQKIFNLNIL